MEELKVVFNEVANERVEEEWLSMFISTRKESSVFVVGLPLDSTLRGLSNMLSTRLSQESRLNSPPRVFGSSQGTKNKRQEARVAVAPQM